MDRAGSDIQVFFGSDKWIIDRIAAAIRNHEPAAALFDRDLCAVFYGRNSYEVSDFPCEKIRSITRFCVAWLNIRLAGVSKAMISADAEELAYQEVLRGLRRLGSWHMTERPAALRRGLFEKISSLVELAPYHEGILPEARERHVVMIVSNPDNALSRIWPGRSVFKPRPGDLAGSPFTAIHPDLGGCISPLDHFNCAAHRQLFRSREGTMVSSERLLVHVPSSMMRDEGDPCILWAQGRGLGVQFVLDLDDSSLPDAYLRFLMSSTTRLIFETDEGELVSYLVSRKCRAD